MATFQIDRSHHGSLPVLGGVDTITSAQARSSAFVFNRSASAIYVRMDGDNPSMTGANDGDMVIPSGSWREFPFLDAQSPEIRLASTTALAYSVEIY